MTYNTATIRSFLQTLTLDTTLADFSQHRQLNAAIVEHCHSLGVVTLRNLFDYYYKNYRFYNTNSGQLKGDDIIQEFCARYQYLYEGKLNEEKLAPDLNEIQFENYLRFFQSKISIFPNRIIATLNPSNPLKIYEEYIQADKSFHFLDKFSKYAIQDLDAIRIELRKHAHELINKPKSFEFDELSDTCVKHYGCTREKMEIFRQKADVGQFPLFGFINCLIDNKEVFSIEEVNTMKYLMEWLNNDDITSNNNNSFLGTTSINRFQLSFKEKLAPLFAHRKYIAQSTNYEFDDKSPYVIISTEESERLNIIENACFTPSMYCYLIKCFFLPLHEHFMQPKTTKSSYLIRKDVMDGFKINAFFSQHENLLSHRVIFENITDLITPFVRYNAFQLQPVAEELIRHMLSKHEIKEESLKIDHKFSRKIKSNVEPKKKREKDTELYGYYAYVAELEALKASKINQ